MQRSLFKNSWGLSRSLTKFYLSPPRSVGNTVVPLAPPTPPPPPPQQQTMPMDGESFNWLDNRPVPPQRIKLMMSNFGRASLADSDKSWQYPGWLESMLAVGTPLETTCFAKSNDNFNSGTGKTGGSPPKGSSSSFNDEDGEDDDDHAAADDGHGERPRAESIPEQTNMEHEGVYWTGDGRRVDTRLVEGDQDQDAYVTGDGKFAAAERKEQPEVMPSDKPQAPTKSKK